MYRWNGKKLWTSCSLFDKQAITDFLLGGKVDQFSIILFERFSYWNRLRLFFAIVKRWCTRAKVKTIHRGEFTVVVPLSRWTLDTRAHVSFIPLAAKLIQIQTTLLIALCDWRSGKNIKIYLCFVKNTGLLKFVIETREHALKDANVMPHDFSYVSLQHRH